MIPGMRYPDYNCPECGHRPFGHVDGGSFCPECGYYFKDDEDGGNGDEEEGEFLRESEISERHPSQHS